jgi:hypothetical protein
MLARCLLLMMRFSFAAMLSEAKHLREAICRAAARRRSC